MIVSLEIKSLYNYLEVYKIQDLCHDPARTVARHLTQKIAKSRGLEPHCILGSLRKFNNKTSSAHSSSINASESLSESSSLRIEFKMSFNWSSPRG